MLFLFQLIIKSKELKSMTKEACTNKNPNVLCTRNIFKKLKHTGKRRPSLYLFTLIVQEAINVYSRKI